VVKVDLDVGVYCEPVGLVIDVTRVPLACGECTGG